METFVNNTNYNLSINLIEFFFMDPLLMKVYIVNLNFKVHRLNLLIILDLPTNLFSLIKIIAEINHSVYTTNHDKYK